jgi:hypothetical protein
MTWAKGIAKCGRVEALDPASLRRQHPEIPAAIKSEQRSKGRVSVLVVAESPVLTRGTVSRFCEWANSRTGAGPIFPRWRLIEESGPQENVYVSLAFKVVGATLQPEKTTLMRLSPEGSV